MGLIKRIDEICSLSGVGLLKGEPVKIILKDAAQPYNIATPRQVPISLLPKVKEELKRMESIGVIEK